MYSTILRLTLKGVPLTAAVLNALLGLQFVWWVVFGRYVLATWIEPTTMSAQEREEMNASARNATNSSALLAAGFCFLIFVICAALILVPARRERREVALQLRTFDVRKAEAWSEADKLYVLEKVRGWYGGSEEALDSFNQFVRTDVATRLGWMQWRREAVIATLILLVSFILWCGLVFAFSIFTSRTIKPLGWPTISVDLVTWAVPDHCFLANPWMQLYGWCNTTWGAGHHIWVPDAPCFNGVLVDAPAQVPEGCVPSFVGSISMSTRSTGSTWYVSADAQQVIWITYAAMLGYSLAVCCGTMWWARPETRPYAGEAACCRCCGTMWWARPETRPYAKGEAAKGTTAKATAGAGNGAMDTGAGAGGVVELTAGVQV